MIRNCKEGHRFDLRLLISILNVLIVICIEVVKDR